MRRPAVAVRLTICAVIGAVYAASFLLPVSSDGKWFPPGCGGHLVAGPPCHPSPPLGAEVFSSFLFLLIPPQLDISSIGNTLLGAFTFGYAVWFANPALWLGIVLLAAGRWRGAATSGVVALVLAIAAAVYYVLWVGTGDPSALFTLRFGYYLWLGSVVLLACAWAFRPRSADDSTANRLVITLPDWMARRPAYLIARTLSLLLLPSVLTFAVLTSMPGDPLDRMLEDNPNFTFEDYMRLRASYGLDDPVYIRYFKWMSQNLQGNLGYSRQYKTPVGDLVGPRLQSTLTLVAATIAFGAGGALLLGVLLAATRYWLVDVPIRALLLLGSSLPAFLLAFLLLVFVGALMPPGTLKFLTNEAVYPVMPVFVLSFAQMAAWARYARNNMASVQADGGTNFGSNFWAWTLAVLNSVGARFATLLATVVVVEIVFRSPGVGKLFYESLMGNDFVVSVAVLMILIYLSVVAGLLGEILGWLRSRLSHRERRSGSAPSAAAVSTSPDSGAADGADRINTALRRAAIVAGAGVLVLMLFFSYLGPRFSPYQPDQVNLRERFAKPSLMTAGAPTGQEAPQTAQARLSAHPFGTDDLGRDTMTRAMYAGQVSLGIGVLVAVFGILFAAAAGAVASSLGVQWDYVADPVVSFRNALPDVPVLLVLAKVFPPGFVTICVILLLLTLGGLRFTRPALLAHKNEELLDGQEVAHVRTARSTSPQSFVAALSGLAVAAALYAGWAVGVEATVSFLGLGIQPSMASWGNMFSNALQYSRGAPWLAVVPGACIFLTLLGLNLVADGLRRIPVDGAIGR